MPQTIQMAVGETRTLGVNLSEALDPAFPNSPSKTTLPTAWTSSNPAVASVATLVPVPGPTAQGAVVAVVSALAVGQAVITAQAADGSDTLTVNVVAAPKVKVQILLGGV